MSLEKVELLALKATNRDSLGPAVIVGWFAAHYAPTKFPILIISLIDFLELSHLELGQIPLLISEWDNRIVINFVPLLDIEPDGHFIGQHSPVSFTDLLNGDLFVTLQQFPVRCFLQGFHCVPHYLQECGFEHLVVLV